MTERAPVEVTNLDIYGYSELPWSRPRDLLAASPTRSDITFFLGTVRPDGHPHAAGPATRKARNLASNPACTLSVRLEGIDLILEGEASRVTDQPTLERAAQLYREGGWPAEGQGDVFTAPFSAPSAGPPPWDIYRFTFHTAFGVATAEPYGATRWRFDH